jgi:hypothetical protein
MDWSKVICIQISKYNHYQLDIISAQLNLIDGLLKTAKDSGTTHVYWETTKPFFLAVVKKESFRNNYETPLYKGLIMLNDCYRGFSKKDKDRLLKIRPTEFDTKKRKQIPNQSIPKVETIVQNKESVSDSQKHPFENYSELTIDGILDKILDYGYDSLTKYEKQFLDNQSKN